MKYTTLAHHRDFAQAIRGIAADDHYLIAAIYLLTADRDLWRRSRHHVHKERVQFDNISITNCTTNQYNLFSCAKDIYCGTQTFTVSELVDEIIVTPRTFQIICNAMAIARNGINALKSIGGA